MFKRSIWLAVATIIFTLQLFIRPVFAVELTEAQRTVVADPSGKEIVLSIKQVERGKKLFNDTCSQCHTGGVTKTDFNVGLGPKDLAGATPPRNNIAALVDYMKNPTTYDGFDEISELHPATKSADIFPEMRNLTDTDLADIAGHILIQPKIVGEQWGGGKAVR